MRPGASREKLMLFIDPWDWLEPDGSLPPGQPQLWPKIMRVAQAIEAGWDLLPASARPLLLMCSKRPQRQRCPGQLLVARRSDDQLVVFCPACGSQEMSIGNWQRTPWARPRAEPLSMLPQSRLDQVELEDLVLAMTEDVDEWAS